MTDSQSEEKSVAPLSSFVLSFLSGGGVGWSFNEARHKGKKPAGDD